MPTNKNRLVKPEIPVQNDACCIGDIYRNTFRKIRGNFPEAMASKLRVKMNR